MTVKPLMTKDLVGIPGKEAVLLTVDYLPGGASMPHRHEAQVFLYVVEGSIVTQVAGQAPVTLHAGQTFYEPDRHPPDRQECEPDRAGQGGRLHRQR